GDPTDGKVYVFVGKTRKVMKLLHWERGGYVMYYKRLETGRLSPRLFPPDQHIGFREIRWDELALFHRRNIAERPAQKAFPSKRKQR
ncbi:MAG: transposase, partial [Bacteroidales bacterium]|nr:transposase [Bacteroidales bacterium]